MHGTRRALNKVVLEERIPESQQVSMTQRQRGEPEHGHHPYNPIQRLPYLWNR